MATARPESSDLNSLSVNQTTGCAFEESDEPLPTFESAAVDYYNAGICVIPTGGADGKMPRERGFMRYARERPHHKTLERWTRDWPTANIGIMAGPVSRLTVVDVDDPALLDLAVAEFGDTPVIDRSPSGGSHLYYRHNGEKTVNRLSGARIDVRGASGNPLVIAPPSIRPDNFKRYEFLSGGVADLVRLPMARRGSLPLVNDIPKRPAKSWSEMHDGDGRNSSLFQRTLQLAHKYSPEEVIDRALAANGNFEMPLPLDEALKAIHSALDYEVRGENWVGQEARAQITAAELESLGGHSDAALLLMRLRAAHGWSNGGEFILANATSRTFGWGLEKFRNARDFLADTGFLIRVHPGGDGRHDPPIYRLPQKVSEIHTNITITPPPPLMED